MNERDVILDVDHLTMSFGGLVAIDDLSFTARRGEITAIIGPNGAGRPPYSTASPASTRRVKA